MNVQRLAIVLGSLVVLAALLVVMTAAFVPPDLRVYAITAITGALTPVVSGALITFLLGDVKASQRDLTLKQTDMLEKQSTLQASVDEVHLMVNSSFSKVQRDLDVALAERAQLQVENARLNAKPIERRA